MEIEACYCNLGMKDFDILPAHQHLNHPLRQDPDEVVFWVNWRQIYRELTRVYV